MRPQVFAFIGLAGSGLLDPTTLPFTLALRGDFAVPWNSIATAGTSANNYADTLGTDPTPGTALNGHVPADVAAGSGQWLLGAKPGPAALKTADIFDDAVGLYCAALVKVRSAADPEDPTAPYSNPSIIGDDGGGSGLVLSKAGVRAFCLTGGGYVNTGWKAVPPGEYCWIEWWWAGPGTPMHIAVNGDEGAASANMTPSGGLFAAESVRFFANFADTSIDAVVEELWCAAVDIGGTNRAGMRAYAAARYAITMANYSTTNGAIGSYGTLIIDIDPGHFAWQDGTNVQGIGDRSNGGFAMLPSSPGFFPTPAPPDWVAADASYNNKSTVKFQADGSAPFLVTSDFADAAMAALLTGPVTLVLVAHRSEANDSNNYAVMTKTGAPWGCYAGSAGTDWIQYFDDSTTDDPALADAKTPAVMVFVFDGGGGGSKIYSTSKTAVSTTGPAPSTIAAGLLLGNWQSPSGDTFTLGGPVARMAVYAGALTNTAVGNLLDDLGAQYGISIAP